LVGLAQQPHPSYGVKQIDGGAFPDQGYCGSRFLAIQNTTRNIDVRLCTKNIIGQPKVVLKAALDLELALLLLKQTHHSFSFNYQRRTVPLLPIVGAAVHIIRHIVWEIEKALQRYAATLFYYHLLQPSEEEAADYYKRQPHDWVHSLYLCQKSSFFLALSLLQDAGLCPGMDSFWWDCHRFFSQKDCDLHEQLAEVLSRRLSGDTVPLKEMIFEDQVVGLFKLLPACPVAHSRF